MTTRAQHILSLCEKLSHSIWQPFVPDAAAVNAHMTQGRLLSPLANAAPIFTGAGLALSAGVAAHGVHAANTRRDTKIGQTGLGSQYSQARSDLGSLRRKNIASLGLRPGLAAKVQVQKARVQDIQNRGLHQYHMGQTTPPQAQRG